jgi:hypothetical protein
VAFNATNIIGVSSETGYEPQYRVSSVYNPLHTFALPKADQRRYQQQYGDMYFLRLAKLKPEVEKVAGEAWDGFSVSIFLHKHNTMEDHWAVG